MKIEEIEVRRLLLPITRTTKAFWIAIAALIIGVAIWLYAWGTQLTTGLIVTGMRDVGVGASWGLYIANFIFFIGISHAGIAISAAVRIAKLERYRAITRMAELLTIVSLMMAMLMIISDIGRPDRIFNIILHYPERLPYSPLVWDITAVATYFILSSTYFYLTLREDIAICLKEVPKFKRLYSLLLPLYKAGEWEKMERIAWWMAIGIVPVMVFVHSTVAWIFGLTIGRPGWYSTIFGPYFVTAAVASGLATVIVIAAIFRKLFNWKEVLPDDIFRGIANMLTVVTIIYLYFMVSELLTIMFAGPHAEITVFEQLLFHAGPYTMAYWATVVVGLFIPFILLFAQAINRRLFSVKLVTIASVLLIIGLWIKRVVMIIPSFLAGVYLPYQMGGFYVPYQVGIYVPTWVEWAIVTATFVLSTLIYLLFVKIFPIIPIHELTRKEK